MRAFFGDQQDVFMATAVVSLPCTAYFHGNDLHARLNYARCNLKVELINPLMGS